jgi:hypothetical protein
MPLNKYSDISAHLYKQGDRNHGSETLLNKPSTTINSKFDCELAKYLDAAQSAIFIKPK